jgi:hypothetical protein
MHRFDYIRPIHRLRNSTHNSWLGSLLADMLTMRPRFGNELTSLRIDEGDRRELKRMIVEGDPVRRQSQDRLTTVMLEKFFSRCPNRLQGVD